MVFAISKDRRSFSLLLVILIAVCFQLYIVITRFFDPDSVLPNRPKLSELQSEHGFYAIFLKNYAVPHYTKIMR